jgi:hypothetical protein
MLLSFIVNGRARPFRTGARLSYGVDADFVEHRHVACVPSGDILRCFADSRLQTRQAHRLQAALLKSWLKSAAAGVSPAEREATDTVATTEGVRWLRFSTKPLQVYVPQQVRFVHDDCSLRKCAKQRVSVLL